MRMAFLTALIFFVGCATQNGGSGSSGTSSSGSAPVTGSGAGVKIVKPATLADVDSPVEVCMETTGYTVEPAKNGVNPGKGHHHLIIDVPLPDLSQPIPKDGNHVHMGDGSTCKSLTLSKGQHTITALFAQGNHVPYDPPVKHSITITVN